LKKVAVTGLEGFTGRYVKEALEARGFEVVGIKSDIMNYESLTSELANMKPDAVLHLAAISFPAHGDYKEIYDVNLHGSVNLLRAIKKQKSIKKTILASSSNVYGAVGGSISESVCPQPINHYGISKLAMEYAAVAEGVECIITRPFNYTGVGQAEHFLVPKIVSHFAQKKESIELGNIDVYRDFSDVRWVGGIYASLVESSATSGVLNICSGRAVSLKYIIECLEKLAKYKIEIKINPAFVRINEIEIISGDMGKLRSILPTISSSIKIEDTLELMYAKSINA
jgi:nucleoside-diphosphate-sugar epimerase